MAEQQELAAALDRLNNNLSAAPADAEKCFVSLDDHRTILAALRAQPQAGSVEQVRHLAAILEEWDMKDPPDETCGWPYEDIARDALTRLQSLQPGIAALSGDGRGGG